MAQVQICRGFGDKDWEELSKQLRRSENEKEWQDAISIFERRMNERFFSCIAELETRKPEKYKAVPDKPNPLRKPRAKEITTPGFVVVALCCLLIDTLEVFRTGDKCKQCGKERSTNERFRTFLPHLGINQDGPELNYFAKGIRHKLLHRSETNGWLIRRNKPRGKIIACNESPYILNRTRLCEELRWYFKRYVDEVRGGKNEELRKYFHCGMDHIAETCRKIEPNSEACKGHQNTNCKLNVRSAFKIRARR